MNLLIIEPMNIDSGRRLIEAAKKLNLKPNLLTVSNNKLEPLFSFVDGVYFANSLSDDPANILKILDKRFLGIVPGSEFSVELSDRLAAKLSLKHNSLERIEAMRSKDIMRANFRSFGIKQPTVYKIIRSSEELKYFEDNDLSYPLIVKPVDMAGSAFVRLCYDWKTVESQVNSILSYRKSLVTNIDFRGRALIEEYVSGEEYSVEAIIINGKSVFQSVTKKILSPLPFCEELGHIVGIDYSLQFLDAVNNLVNSVSKSWNMQFGCIHAEFKATISGLSIIEAACRIPGDFISDLIELKSGVSLESALIGIRCQIPDLNKYNNRNVINGIVGVRHYFESNFNDKLPLNAILIRENRTDKKPTGVSPFSVGNRCGYVIFSSYELSKELKCFVGLE